MGGMMKGAAGGGLGGGMGSLSAGGELAFGGGGGGGFGKSAGGFCKSIAAAWAEEEDLAAREGAWMAAVLLAGTNRPHLGVASRRLEDREEEEEEKDMLVV